MIRCAVGGADRKVFLYSNRMPSKADVFPKDATE